MKDTAKTIVLMVMFLGLVACTEDRVQKEALKYEVYEKNSIDPSAEYLYVPSTLSTSRHAAFGRAYWLGAEKVVKMELTEFNLDIYAIDREKKFADNPSNKRLVMSIPVKHVDYRCADDAFGECLSEEVEDSRIPWNQKKYFQPLFEQTRFADSNYLPGDLPSSCYQVKDKKLISRKLTPDSINFRLTRDYQNELYFFCYRGLDNVLQDLNWSDVTHYSFVRLNTISSPDYERVVYHEDWISKFGFFEQEETILDIDGNKTQDGQIKLLQRWNPKRKSVVYNLSEAFNKPENAVIKAATYESFHRINQGLKTAGIGFELQLKEYDPSIDPGDLRNSMIILAEDPYEASVIGYGPSITNPYTGEILSARTVMYAGSLRKFVRNTYEDIVNGRSTASSSAVNAGDGPSSANNTESFEVANWSPEGHIDIATQMESWQSLENFLGSVLNKSVNRIPQLTDADLQKAADIAQHEDLIAQLSNQGMYPAELVQFGDVNQEIIQELVKNIGALKPWENLTAAQKQSVLDTLVPYGWIPVLVHEIGHNLGLRHNFQGSNDSQNYYSKEELKNLNLPVSEGEVPYASVMDYPKSEVNALRTLGKYDIAALRFGYQLKAESANGALVDVNPADPSGISGIKEYKFCSDEGVPLNANCNAFDEGDNYFKIAESLIDTYKTGYWRSNFRRGRANFSTMDDDLYFSRINRTFSKLRMLFELYNTLRESYNYTQAQIEADPWAKDLNQAVELSADFMMDVIREPALNCALLDKQQSIVFPIPIEGVSKMAYGDCYALQLNTRYEVVGQTGKSHNSYKVRSNPSRYVDQIDNRGIWIDKALATRTLFRRRMNISTFDREHGNYLDHPNVAPKLKTLISDVLFDKMDKEVVFERPDGTSFPPFSLSYSLSSDSYVVRTPDMPIISRVLSLPYDNMFLGDILTRQIKVGNEDGIQNANSLGLQQELQVRPIAAHEATDCNTQRCSVQIRGGQWIYTDNTHPIAFDLMKKLQLTRVYERLAPQEDITRLRELLQLIQSGQPAPANLTTDELVAFESGAEKLTDYMNRLSSSLYFESVLASLAQ